jgi:uncharacterized membrane protein YeaQ/YmgE (transglycosylase-associated protein family)
MGQQRDIAAGVENCMHFLWWIIVGLIAGWATGKIMRGSGYGPVVDIIVGIAGAILGGWIMRAVGFSGRGGLLYTILVAIGGAIVLTWLYRLVTGSRTHRNLSDEEQKNIRRVA